MKAFCAWLGAAVVVSLLVGCGGGEKKGPDLATELKKAMALTDPAAKARTLASVADKQRKAGDVLGAQKTLATATSAAEQIEDPGSKAGSLIRVGSSLLRGGDLTDGLDTLKKAEKTVETIAEESKKAGVLAELAVAYREEKAEKSKVLLKMARDTAAKIEAPDQKMLALSRIGDALVKADMKDDAKQLVGDIAELARALPDKRQQADGLTDAAIVAGKADPESSTALLAEADKTADSIEEAYGKGHAYLSIARKLAAGGKKSDAKARVAKAIELADKVKSASEGQELRDEANTLKETL